MRRKLLCIAILSLFGVLFGFESRAADWCHTFNSNLKFGNSGVEIFHLKTALIKSGVWGSSEVTSKFDAKTFSAVVAFQEKYKSEVLTPFGYKKGTGNVGPATRTKLNKLYGCQAALPAPAPATSSLALLSPNGGEKLTQGGNVLIKWSASGLEKVTLVLINYSVGDQTVIADLVSATSSQYSWTIPYTVFNGDKYKILVKFGKTSDLSDNYFNIASAKKSLAPSLALISPIGGEQWEKGKSYSIRWLFQDLDRIDEISLTNYSKSETYSLANNIGASLNSYDWSIPLFLNTVPAGTQYKVKIKSCPSATCYTDESDNYFTILAGSGALMVESRLADITSAIERLAEQIRELLGR